MNRLNKLFFFMSALFLFCLSLPLYAQNDGVSVSSAKIKEENAKYNIDLEYPQIDGDSSPGVTSFNKSMKKEMDDFVSEFRDDIAKNQIDEERPWSIYMTFNIKYNKNRIISIFFDGGYHSGGAHPAPIVYTKNYDLDTGKELISDDLFKKDADWVTPVSRYCIQELKKEEDSDETWIKEGAGPQKDNYSHFYLCPKGPVAVFPPYQVAPYVRGAVEIIIPLDKIKDIIEPQGIWAKIKE